jgi:transposase
VKQWALQLIAEGWSLEQVIEAIGVSRRSIDRWMDNYETFGSTIRFPSDGLNTDLKNRGAREPVWRQRLGQNLELYHTTSA